MDLCRLLGNRPIQETGTLNLRILSFLMALLISAPAYATSYADPAGSGVLVGAVNWLQGTLLGIVATTVAVVAIGFVRLTDRGCGKVQIRSFTPQQRTQYSIPQLCGL